jgi:hypothetical protein
MAHGQRAITVDDVVYIRRNWLLLAAAAWRGFLQQGRGAILIDLSLGMMPVACYRTWLSDALSSAWPSARIARQIRDYNPRHEAIFLVLRDDDTITTYCLAGHGMSPPDAYERLRHTRQVAAA